MALVFEKEEMKAKVGDKHLARINVVPEFCDSYFRPSYKGGSAHLAQSFTNQM